MEQGKGVSIEKVNRYILLNNLLKGMEDFAEMLKRYHDKFDGEIVIGMDHLDIDATWINLYLDMAGYDPLCKLFGKIEFMIDFSSYHKGCARVSHKKV
jgi:hypothetical protein